MRQLAGTDAYHVLEESPSQHMHTIKIVIADPDGHPIGYEATRAWVAERLPRIPPFRWRLVPIPLGLGRPLFVDAPDLDLDYHVQRAALPVPGDDAQLDDLVSSITSTQLDRDKPLWQLWFVEGLSGGRVALVFKMHHAIADGGASVRVLEEAFGASEPPDPVPPPPERPPSTLARVLLALRLQLALLRRLPGQLAATLAWLRRSSRQKKEGRAGTAPLAAPPTRFNNPLTPNRAYVNVTVPLADLRRVKDALGGTLNDVFIALCGGALRRYLAERRELPETTLTAASPVGLRDEKSDPYGNSISYWYVSLATDAPEPGARIAGVRASTSAARDAAEEDPGVFARWQDHYLLFRLVSVRGLALAERLAKRPAFNAIVSNVKGPRSLRFQEAPVVSVRSMGPLTGRQGLNFTGWSYNDEFAIGLHACREHAPDLRHLADLVIEELNEMLEAAGAKRMAVASSQ